MKQDELNYDYRNKNNRIYSIISLDKNLTTIEKTLIKGQIDSKIYHIEFGSSAGANNIEIHLKGITDNSLELMKGNEK